MSESPIQGVKRVRKTLADGTVKMFFYHRGTGRRLPDDPTTADFRSALAANDRDAAPPEPVAEMTLRHLIQKYQAAPDWTELKPYTREIAQYQVNAIDTEFGTLPISAIERRGARTMFLEWRNDGAEEHPSGADAKLVRLARILKFAFDSELIDRHPLASFRRVYKVDRSEVLWLPEHFKKLGATASEAIKLAAFAALHTGQRRGDLLALRWRQYDGEWLKLTQRKTGARVEIPCTQALKVTLDALRAERQPTPDDFILHSSRGVAWTIESFKQAWRYAVLAADLPPIEIEREDGTKESFGLHFHDIRGTAVTMLAEAGCTIPEIASITGHSLASATRILEKYLGATRVMARSAITKLELRMIG